MFGDACRAWSHIRLASPAGWLGPIVARTVGAGEASNGTRKGPGRTYMSCRTGCVSTDSDCPVYPISFLLLLVLLLLVVSRSPRLRTDRHHGHPPWNDRGDPRGCCCSRLSIGPILTTGHSHAARARRGAADCCVSMATFRPTTTTTTTTTAKQRRGWLLLAAVRK